MKKMKAAVILFTFLLPMNFYAQDTGTASASQPASASAGENTELSLAKKLFIGFDLSGGFSKSIGGNFSDGSIVVKFAPAGAAVLHYYITNSLGIAVNIGYHFFSSYEEDSTAAFHHDFKLHYLSFSFMPIIRFNGIYFAFGMYLGFPISAKYEGTNPSLLSKISCYTTPDIGFQFKAGYIFRLSAKADMYAGVEIKNQLSNFYSNMNYNGKVFAFYVNLGWLFNVK